MFIAEGINTVVSITEKSVGKTFMFDCVNKISTAGCNTVKFSLTTLIFNNEKLIILGGIVVGT